MKVLSNEDRQQETRPENRVGSASAFIGPLPFFVWSWNRLLHSNWPAHAGQTGAIRASSLFL
jgi:hypothetical protein